MRNGSCFLCLILLFVCVGDVVCMGVIWWHAGVYVAYIEPFYSLYFEGGDGFYVLAAHHY